MEFPKPGGETETKVYAHYSDGKKRDITNLALYQSNNESVARIDEHGKLKTKQPGATHVFARFDRFTVGAEVIVLPEGKFTFPEIEAENYIDELVHARLEKLRVLPSELCTDEQFLRRVTIDLNGKLPTPEEYESFVANTAAGQACPSRGRTDFTRCLRRTLDSQMGRVAANQDRHEPGVRHCNESRLELLPLAAGTNA